MKRIKIWNNSASHKQLQEIANRLKDGEIGIIPTDTMYAIAGDALNQKAIERICRIKGINPAKTNLSIICEGISQAAEYSRIDNRNFSIMKRNCPGAFTFLLPAASSLPKAFKGRKIVGIRIPDLDFDRELAELLGNPIISTSVPYSEEDYAVNPDLLAEDLGHLVDFIVEGEDGSTDVSTIIDCTCDKPEILRQGIGVLE